MTMARKATKPLDCFNCGAQMRYEIRDDVMTYKGKSRAFKQLAWWCPRCEQAVVEGAPLAARDKAFIAFRAEVDGVLAPAQVAKIRTRLGLSQRKASELLGGGPRAFQKYESGSQMPSVPMSHLLRLLDKHPSQLRELLPGAPTKRSTPKRLESRARPPSAARRATSKATRR